MYELHMLILAVASQKAGGSFDDDLYGPELLSLIHTSTIW